MPEAVLAAVRIREVRVVENVKDLGAELGAHPLPQMPVLSQREIEVAETGIVKIWFLVFLS